VTAPLAGFRLAIRDLSPTGSQVFLSDRWTITSGSAMPGFPTSKLQTDLLSDYLSAYNHRPSNTWIQAQSDAATSSARTLGLIGLLGLNRRSPSSLLTGTSYTANTIRFRVDSYPLSDRIRPTFTLSSSVNLNELDPGLVHPLNPPDDPAPSGYAEGKMAPASSILATSAVILFANPYATERVLSGTQTFRVHLRDANNPAQIPLTTVVLYQSGSPVKTLAPVSYEKVAVSNSSGGFIITYAFLVSDLASTTAAIEMHVSTSTACDFIGTELLLNHTGYLYDSGVIDYSGTDLMMAVQALDLTLPSGAIYVHVEFSDFCSYTSGTYTKVGGGTASAATYTSIVQPGDADGRLHVGRFLVADSIIFPINGLAGYNIQSQSDSQPARTRSGSLAGNRVQIDWNDYDLSIIGISRVLQQRIERQIRALGIMRTPTLVYPDPNMTEGYVDEQTMPRWVAVASKAESHIGRLTGIDSDVNADGLNHTRDRWDTMLHLTDHNGVRSGGG
jgi:hypothetical protein